MRPLLCAKCGGPLPAPSATARTLECTFCGTHAALDLGAPPVHEAAQVSAVDFAAAHGERLAAYEHAINARLSAGEPALPAFRAAALELGALCDPETLTRVVFGLAREFERERGVDLREHPNALPRLAVSYLGALRSVAADGAHDLRIPMIAANANGPIDYSVTLRPEHLAALAAVAPEAQKRKGFFARFFGS